jgi:hypothetical protein
MAGAAVAFGNWLASPRRRLNLLAAALSGAYAGLLMMMGSLASFYTLDDPYIHMALAETIARGSFGVNPGEVANPSSSIAWPWILAAFEKIGLMLWAPLLINIACFIVSLNVVLSFCLVRLAPKALGASNAQILIGLAFLSFNLFGVIFTGMEHSLHVLLSVIAVSRIIDGKYDALTLCALVLAPMVRFEAAIILAFGVGAALIDRKWSFAAAAAAGAAAPVGLYSWWLTGLGLPILPSSVLTKSAASSGLVDGGGGFVEGLLATFVQNLSEDSGPMIGVLAIALIYAAAKRTGRDQAMAIGLLIVLLLAMTLGKMNSYARYEVYLLCSLGLGITHLLADELRRVLTSRARTLLLGAGLCVLGMALGPFVLLTTPLAARNIDRQQHQMHRLLTECWKKPAAVNDLGWASFRNDAHVLDLIGLGSEDARRARTAGEPGWMAKLVAQSRVGAAMIYPEWFQEISPAWRHVADFKLDGPRITPFSDTVAVYATTESAITELTRCLQQLAPGLPLGARIAFDANH